jgi:hypothetical protein
MDTPQRQRFACLNFFSTVSRRALGFTQPPVQWVRGALSLGTKRPGCEADLSSAEVKNAWRFTSTTPIRLHGVVLRKHSDCVTILVKYKIGSVEYMLH